VYSKNNFLKNAFDISSVFLVLIVSYFIMLLLLLWRIRSRSDNNVLYFQRQLLGCFRTLSLIHDDKETPLSLEPRCCRGSNPSRGRKFEKKSSLKGWEREFCVAPFPRGEPMLGIRVKKGHHHGA